MPQPLASIIVRTLNERRHLERLFQGLQRQTHAPWEVILVDSGSDDGTVEIARRYGARVSEIAREDFTFGRALNIGCRHASGQYLVFVSGHTYPLNNVWLSNLLRPFADPLIGLVYGRQRGVPVTRISEERDFELTYGTAARILLDEPHGHNANAAIRRDLWLSTPFDETLPGLEDLEWAQRIQQQGFRVYYAPDAAIAHVHEERLRQLYTRYFREGVAYRLIFPGRRPRRRYMVKNFVYHVTADALYGLRHRKPFTKIAEIIPTRLVQMLALWRGMTDDGHVARAARSRTVPLASESVVIEGPGRHAFVPTPVPDIDAGDVLIEVAYVGVCATDMEVASGSLEYYRTGAARYPIVPGHEYSGVIAAVGTQVDTLRVGDRVVGECAIGCGECQACGRQEYFRCATRREVGVMNINGAYARFLRLPARHVHRIPRGVSLKEAALIEPLAVCLKAVRRLNPVAGRTVGVVGAGPLGNMCAQVLKQRGLEVTAIDRDEQRLRLLHRYDVNVQTDLRGLEEFDYLVEVTGSEAVVAEMIARSKPSSRILLLGLPYQNVVPVTFASVPCYDKEIFGSIASAPEDWRAAIDAIRHDRIDLSNHLMHVLPLRSYAQAWHAIENRSAFKVLLSSAALSDEVTR